MTKRIINFEQVSAALEAAQARNPNRKRLDELRAQSRLIDKEISSLVSYDEKAAGLMLLLSKDFDSRTAAVKLMSDAEIASHMFDLFIDHVSNDMDQAIFDEALSRLGYGTDEEDEDAKAA